MTDTVPTTEIPDNRTHQPLGTLEHLDPNTLVLETNVRDEAKVDAQFLASIKEHGVLIPIGGVRQDDGQVRVRAGQRRTLAAREEGLPTVPVYVRPVTASGEAAQLAERVSEQIVENDQRRQNSAP
jgi:ParB family transcriptional regulator, chromosome partitioning protein